MSEFLLEGFGDPVLVSLTDNITKEELLTFPAFNVWEKALKHNLEEQKRKDHTFNNDPFTLRKIVIHSVDKVEVTKQGRVEKRILFVKLYAEIRNSKGQDVPGIAFLRGGSVAVLMILQPSDMREDKKVIMTEQARIPAGSLAFREIPAGMIDDENTFVGAAAKEILEETHLKIREEDLIDLTALALKNDTDERELLKHAMYPSPGGCDEFIALLLWRKEMDRMEIEDLRDKFTGKRNDGEKIKLYLCDYEDLWKVGARDAKTLAAWALYEALNRSGVLGAELKRRDEQKAKDNQPVPDGDSE